MSTHDLDIALQTADELWLIDKQLGIRTGTHKELTQSGDLERYFSAPGLRFSHEGGFFTIDTEYL